MNLNLEFEFENITLKLNLEERDEMVTETKRNAEINSMIIIRYHYRSIILNLKISEILKKGDGHC